MLWTILQFAILAVILAGGWLVLKYDLDLTEEEDNEW